MSIHRINGPSVPGQNQTIDSDHNAETKERGNEGGGEQGHDPEVEPGEVNDPFNYEEKYPEDALNAKVWRTHEDESRIHDANMVEESRDNVDVLLVLTYQNLQADCTAISSSPLNPNTTFVPATTDVWVNGLWFVSLFLSLTAAFVAVLAKQWLHHDVVLPSGTPRDRSFTRQFRYTGFQKWHVQVIIGLLPVLMHLALAIFLIGLVIFLRPLREALLWIICAATALVYAAYAAAIILPIIFPQRPYHTPLCDLVYVFLRHITPQISWKTYSFLDARRQRGFSDMIRRLPDVQSRDSKSLTMVLCSRRQLTWRLKH
ncbi:uncharacterized protein BT62DRAFT_990043 [Guyanagaster necrorhizus]|uniref:DUF6535 domain-containing protein n=1 Tax=Guyanagaster necrorhizus TaxID=856835 RepID=A0A9P7W6X8_9AGAR|nr:uncharacterized protein BT62DRAFT_990043 [Guyanagaster necrorhizus MCA 3950]KAG7453075.1 hypothetical protein BT62DRAFT_990043 [Guyanagaster necrorhizus MCA 3950]